MKTVDEQFEELPWDEQAVVLTKIINRASTKVLDTAIGKINRATGKVLERALDFHKYW
jgi:hypothetical protein